MTNKLTRLNIISKLNFENITTTQNFANIINDNNPYTKLTWNTFSTSAAMECIVSDNIKYANLSSNYNRFRTQISYFNDRSFNFIIKFRLTELRSIQNIVTINNGTTHFVCNIKNTFDNGLSLYNSNGAISINCNYKFEADIDYVISISKDEDIYKVIINGTQYLCTENSNFKNNLPSSSSNNLILGGIDINASNNANSLRGRLYWANLSIGPTMIFNGSYTKYGSSLKSFLYFGNKAINDTTTSYYAPLEAIEDSIITWNGLENINAENVSVNSLICTGTNSFYTNYNINDLFTLTFKYRLNDAMEDVELISYYGYKLLVTNVVNDDSGNPDVSDVSVNEHTTAALDFENELVDKIPTTIWQKEGTADVTSTNKIFGDNSFETKALGDSLSTTSNIITGGSTPFTIEFYTLIKGRDLNINRNQAYYLFTKNNNSSGGDQTLSVSKEGNLTFSYYNGTSWVGASGDLKVHLNEINKYSLTYDGSVLRGFVNDKMCFVIGKNNGILINTSEPYMFLRHYLPNFSQNSNTTYGIIDNINIHDGIATKVRDPDPYEEFLVVDLAFDGENNSTKIVDNARLKERNEIKYNDYVVSLLHFDDGIIDETLKNYTINGDITTSQEYNKFGTSSLKISAINNNNISCTSNDFIFNNNAFTIECFFRVSGGNNNIFTFGNVALYVNEHADLITLYSDGNIISISGVVLNTWMHLALVRYNGVINIYLNGIKSPGWNNTTNYTSDNIKVGGSTVGLGGYYYVDEFRVTNGVARYTENFTPPTEPFDYIKKNNWAVSGNAKISTDQKFDGFSSLYIPYSNNDRNVTSLSNIIFESGEDFTFSFEFIRLPSTVTFGSIFTTGVSSVPDAGNVWSINAFSSSYNNASFSMLINKVSFINEKSFNKIEDGLVSNTTIQDNVKYKVDIVRSGITTFLYINNVLDSANNVFQNDRIDFSNLCIGTPMWSNGMEAGISCYLKNVKIYKGVAVIPEDPTGKIQLDFDNNVSDKYNNSTWTNNGVTFDQVNSVKGYSAYFDSSNNIAQTYTNSELLNFENKNFKIELDYKTVNNNKQWSSLIIPQNHSYPSQHVEFSTWNSNTLVFQNLGDVNITIIGTNTVLNQWYNAELIRNNNCVYITQNNVITGMTNYTTNNMVNFNVSNNCTIGGINDNKFGGYIDNFKSYKEDLLSNLNTYTTSASNSITATNNTLKITTIASNGMWAKFKDIPFIKNFKCNINFERVSGEISFIFRTTSWSNTNDTYAYIVNLSDTTLGLAKGSNSTASSFTWLTTATFNNNVNTNYKLTVVFNETSIMIYINDILIINYSDSTYNIDGQIGFRSYGDSTSIFKDITIYDLQDNLIYSNDFKSKIDNVIDRPAVHLPLETNATNIGFAPLTINSVGSPTYHIVDGKKCIKFEYGNYLTIDSNNIFNLGTSSDFYIELDLYIPTIHSDGYGHTILNGNGSTNLNSLWLAVTSQIVTGNAITKSICLTIRNPAGENYNNFQTSNLIDLSSWNNLKFYRAGNTITLELNGVKTEFTNFLYPIDLATVGTFIGSMHNNSSNANFDGYMSNFKMFVGTSEIPETYNDKKVLDLDFKPTGKSYLFKDNNNKCVIHPVNITQRDYQDSQYCCTFNGVDQCLQLGKNDLLNFGNDDFVLRIKFKVNNFDNVYQRIFADNVSSGSSKCYIMIPGNSYDLVEHRNAVFFGLDDNSGAYMFSTNKVQANVIYDLVVVRNGNNISMYIDGILENTLISSLPCNFNYLDNTYIGYNVDNLKFKGTIYSIKVLRNTSDLSLLNDPIITPPAPSETIYTLTDGTNTETISLTPELSDNDITFYNKEFFIDVKVNDDNNVMSLPKNTSITDNTLTINNGFKGYIKDIKFYDTVIPFNDSDSFIDYDPYNTEFNQVQVEIISDDFTELNTLNIGNNNITGFLEGCILPISYDIIHKSTGAILMSGDTPYYSYNNIDIRYIDEYVIIDSNNKEYELINKSLDKEGFLIFILDAQSCQGNFCIRLYKHLTGKFVGEYEIINNQCQIDYLFIDERYDAVLFDRDSNIESKTLSDRIPEIKIV